MDGHFYFPGERIKKFLTRSGLLILGWGLILLFWGFEWDFLLWGLLFSFLYPLAISDWFDFSINDKTVIRGIVASWILALLPEPISWSDSIEGAVFCGGFFLLFYLFFPQGIGLGDAKVGLLLGSFLGKETGFLLIITGLVLAFLYFLGGFLMGAINRKSPIPLVSFFTLGVFFVPLLEGYLWN